MKRKPISGPDDPRHGTRNLYGNFGCRCAACCQANTVDCRDRYGRMPMAEYRAQRRANIKHNANAYDKGRCRCDVCRTAASARRARSRQRARERAAS